MRTTPRQVTQVEVVRRRAVVDLHEIGPGGDMASFAARGVVEPDIAAVVVFYTADEKWIIGR
jgi:hypothetical protein